MTVSRLLSDHSLLRAPRVMTSDDTSLVIESRTIGTQVAYRLTTKNVSKSGMLLKCMQSAGAPFMVNTIIEMIIDPSGSWLEGPVSCLGKVVRRENSTSETGVSQFGVHIIQMEHEDATDWENCLKAISKKMTIEPRQAS